MAEDLLNRKSEKRGAERPWQSVCCATVSMGIDDSMDIIYTRTPVSAAKLAKMVPNIDNFQAFFGVFRFQVASTEACPY